MLYVKIFLFIVLIAIGNVHTRRFNRQFTLYDENDDVELFDYQTHDSTLLRNSTKSTIIQYFLHWCGGCQQTAPFWKTLAKETKSWKDVIRVAAVDCALQTNRKLCESLKIMRYPTFRLFDALQFGQPAKEIHEEKRDIKNFINIMIDHVEKQSYKLDSWPNLNAFK
jgi:thiol oxidase